MTVRIVPTAFVADGRLYGPGRRDFGTEIYGWWFVGNTLPDDPDASLPDCFVQVIGVEGLAVAYDRLAARIGHVGPPPITLASVAS